MTAFQAVDKGSIPLSRTRKDTIMEAINLSPQKKRRNEENPKKKEQEQFDQWFSGSIDELEHVSSGDDIPFDKIHEIIAFDPSSLPVSQKKKYKKLFEKVLTIFNGPFCTEGFTSYESAEILKSLDLTSSQSTMKCMKLIPFLERTFLEASFNSYDEDSYNRIMSPILEVLEEKLSNPKNNYFFTTYLAGLARQEYVEDHSQTMKPIRFSQNTFLLEGGRLSEPVDPTIIENLLKEYNNLIDSDEYQELHGSMGHVFSSRKQILKEVLAKKFRFSETTDYEHALFSYFRTGKNIKEELRTFGTQRGISQEKIDHFIYFNTTGIRKIIEQDFQINLYKFSLPEQFSFFEFIHTQTLGSIEKPKKHMERYGNEGFRTFLSLQYGGKEMGDKILDLGEKLPQATAKKIFEKYSQIVDSVQSILDVASNGFKKQLTLDPQLISTIEQSLYTRGALLLKNFHTTLIKGDTNNLESLVQDIEHELDRINADTLVTLSVFKHAVRNGYELPLTDISGSVFSKRDTQDFSGDEIDEMSHIYKKNWENYPDKAFTQNLVKTFQSAFDKNNPQKNYIYTFAKDNHIRAFVRFEEQQDGSLYASALNVDESTKGLSLGEAMMDEALYQEAQEHVLHAKCDPYNESNMRYFEKGFISYTRTSDTLPLFEIIWDEDMNKNISTKQMNQEEIVMMYLQKNIPQDVEIFKALSLQELHNVHVSDKALVRCFKNPVASNEWYAVYEKVN